MFASADLEQGTRRSHEPTSAHILVAAKWALMGGLYNAGEDCTCGSRVFVESSVYDKFLSIVKENIKEYTIGDGFDSKSSAGPLVSFCLGSF